MFKPYLNVNRYQISLWAVIIICALSVFTAGVQAGDRVNTHVRVIHAAQGARHIDAGLDDLAAELESVFRYTSYRLIQSKGMMLGYNEKGRVGLPGKRMLVVSPTSIDGQRIQYRITIHKGKKQVFQTQVLLKNRSSITIGGPQFKKGYLLFNISGRIN
ncbi:MAG: hypothetical protein D3926_20885 [Desulfobacteraceae bacterium]|nr:MAG: hypothetical protein D3926_20885 [Desulfobacteraceae bacterium]